jgi:hypothetical protein
MIWAHTIHFNLMRGGLLQDNQDSPVEEAPGGRFTSLRDLGVQRRVLTLIQMKYSKCFSLGAVGLRCLLMSFLTKLMKEVIPLQKCLEVSKWVVQQGFQECFNLCKVELQEQLGACLEEISILGSHLQVGALVHHLLQDSNSKSFSQMINKSKISEGINLIS